MAKYKEGDVVIIPMLNDPTSMDSAPHALKVWPCAAVIIKESDGVSDYYCCPLICSGSYFTQGSFPRSEEEIATIDDKDRIKRIMLNYWNWHQH